MAGYTKLWSDIVHSTIWREEAHVRLVWITMLAISDRNGYVGASLPGLADAARVTVDECRQALERLSAPDPDSRTKEHEGRRVADADGGWTILNYLYHREREAGERRKVQVREAVRRHRAKNKPPSDVIAYSDFKGESNHGKPMQRHRAEADAKEETTPAPTALVHVNGNGGPSKKKSGLPVRKYDEITARIATIFADVAEGGRQHMQQDEARELQAEMVFAYWAAKLNHTSSMLDRKRANLLKARLRENRGNANELLYVVDGARKDDYLMGRANNSGGKKYDGIETLFRDRGQVEKLAEAGGFAKTPTHPLAAKYEFLVFQP